MDFDDSAALPWEPADDDLLPGRVRTVRRLAEKHAAERASLAPEAEAEADVKADVEPATVEVDLPAPPILVLATADEVDEPAEPDEPAPAEPVADEYTPVRYAPADFADMTDLSDLHDLSDLSDLHDLPDIDAVVDLPPPPMSAPASAREDTPEVEQEFWRRGLAPLHDFSDVRALPEGSLDSLRGDAFDI
jgi:hypothetical protein